MRLRVLDFGYVPALRSQSVYHGIAAVMEAADDPVPSLVNPQTPYVCVGLHQRLRRRSTKNSARRKDCELGIQAEYRPINDVQVAGRKISARNLSIAEDMGFDTVMAPCNGCYHNLKMAADEFVGCAVAA